MAECFAGGHLRFVNGAWRDDNGDPVEIRQVVHGQWIGSGYDFSCSNCGVYQTYLTGRTNYCPNCGAKMDGGENNE